MATLSDFTPTLDLSSRRINVDKATKRIAVRIASWTDTHSGHSGQVRMPKSVNIDAAHVGHATLDDGTDLAVATLPMHVEHAGDGMNAHEASRWYSDTGEGVARVRYSIDDEGIRADGLLFDDLDEARFDRLTAAAPSGDWRAASLVRTPADFENSVADFAGAAIVSIPGFSNTFNKAPMTPLRLVASANSIIAFEEPLPMTDTEDPKPAECTGQCPPCNCGADTPPPEPEPEVLTAAATLTANCGGVEAPIQYNMEEILQRITNLEEILTALAMSM